MNGIELCLGTGVTLTTFGVIIHALRQSANKKDLGNGVIVHRYKNGHGSIAVPEGPIVVRGMSEEETDRYFAKPIPLTRSQKRYEKLKKASGLPDEVFDAYTTSNTPAQIVAAKKNYSRLRPPRNK